MPGVLVTTVLWNDDQGALTWTRKLGMHAHLWRVNKGGEFGLRVLLIRRRSWKIPSS